MKKIICLSFAMICIVIYGFSSKANAAFGDLNITYPDTRSQAPDRCELGNATFVKSGVAKQKDVITFKGPGTENHMGIVDKLYVIYKYDKYINSSIYDFGTTIFVPANSKVHLTFESSESKTISCENFVQTNHGADFNFNLSANIKLFKILGLSADESIERKVSEITKTNYTEFVRRGVIFSQESPVVSKDMNYWYQLRGSFECYVVQIYEIQYDVTTTTEGGWFWKKTYYDYHRKGFKLVEQYANLKLIPRSLEKGLFIVEKNEKEEFCAIIDNNKKKPNTIYVN